LGEGEAGGEGDGDGGCESERGEAHG